MKTTTFLFLMFVWALPVAGQQTWFHRTHRTPRSLTGVISPAAMSGRAATTMMALDSVIFSTGTMVEKDYYTYDTLGREVSHEYHYINSGMPRYGYREEWIYDYRNLMVQYDYYEDTTGTGSWQHSGREVYYYDNSGMLDSLVALENENGVLLPSEAYAWQYNAALLPETVTYYVYETQASIWELFGRALFSYNPQNQPVEILYQAYAGGQWVNDSKEERIYDAAGHWTDNYYYMWNGSSWENSYWINAHYNALDKVDTLAYYQYNNGWTPDYRENYVYDASGIWQSIYFQLYFSTWTSVARMDFAYDMLWDYSSLIVPAILGDDYFITDRDLFARKLDTITVYDYDDINNTWILSAVHHYYYSARPMNISGTEAFSFVLYPNPADNAFFIRTSTPVLEVSLYDASGRCIRQWRAAQPFYRIDRIQPGLYTVRIRTTSGTAVRRLLVR